MAAAGTNQDVDVEIDLLVVNMMRFRRGAGYKQTVELYIAAMIDDDMNSDDDRD